MKLIDLVDFSRDTPHIKYHTVFHIFHHVVSFIGSWQLNQDFVKVTDQYPYWDYYENCYHCSLYSTLYFLLTVVITSWTQKRTSTCCSSQCAYSLSAFAFHYRAFLRHNLIWTSWQVILETSLSAAESEQASTAWWALQALTVWLLFLFYQKLKYCIIVIKLLLVSPWYKANSLFRQNMVSCKTCLFPQIWHNQKGFQQQRQQASCTDLYHLPLNSLYHFQPLWLLCRWSEYMREVLSKHFEGQSCNGLSSNRQLFCHQSDPYCKETLERFWMCQRWLCSCSAFRTWLATCSWYAD